VPALLVWIPVGAIEALCAVTGRAPDDPVKLVALHEQQFHEERAALSGDAVIRAL
jgi:hypothetical protein